jgi:hypothetical protein
MTTVRSNLAVKITNDILAYAEKTYGYEKDALPRNLLIEYLLIDLMHYCQRHRISLEQIWVNSKDTFSYER